MSYPLPRSPHLSQQLLPVSFSRVKTFEVGWLDISGREGKLELGLEELQHLGQRRLQPNPPSWARTDSQLWECLRNDRPPGRLPLLPLLLPLLLLPRLLLLLLLQPPPLSLLCSALTGRQKVQLTRERSLQWEWSGYIKESKERAKTQIRMQATSNLLNLLLLSLLAGLDPSKVWAIFNSCLK